jgi:hypothetical protein
VPHTACKVLFLIARWALAIVTRIALSWLLLVLWR